MARLTINIGTHGTPMTVSAMRKRLAQVLSHLNGSQTVSFSLTVDAEKYTPAPLPEPVVVYGELARPEND